MGILLLLLFTTIAYASGYEFTNLDVHIVATFDKCEYPELLAKGFEYKIEIGVPLTNLEAALDPYKVEDNYAITTSGCWSKKSHKLYAYRKGAPDGYFDPNFNIDKTWKNYDFNRDTN